MTYSSEVLEAGPCREQTQRGLLGRESVGLLQHQQGSGVGPAAAEGQGELLPHVVTLMGELHGSLKHLTTQRAREVRHKKLNVVILSNDFLY